jgi:hypothetical protein
MFHVTRARSSRQRVLRIRTQLVSIEMLITHGPTVLPAHTAEQQIDLVVCFLSHYTTGAAEERT